MNDLRINLLATMRSGSNYATDIIHEYISRVDPEYIPLHAEVTSWHFWWRHFPQTVESANFILKELNIEASQVPDFMPEIYKLLMQRRSFVYKDFPRDLKYVSHTTKIDTIRQRARCIVLTRRSIIDSIISYCIAKHSDVWVHYTYNDIDTPDLVFDPEWLIGALSEYQHLYDAYNRYYSAGIIDNIVYYEDLTFDPSTDILFFFNKAEKFNFECPTKKITTSELKSKFLKRHNFYPLLDDALEYFTFPYDKDYQFKLERT